MNDKEMVNDILSQLNSSLTGYANVIAQTANPQLRQTIQQIRNNCETSQYEFFKLAEQKGFYKPAQPATQSDIQTIKTQLGS